MKNGMYFLAALLIFTASAFTVLTTPSNYTIGAHAIKFKTEHVDDGKFATMTGTIVFDEANLAASKFDVTIDANSLNTGNAMRNSHAKSKGWFDVKTYPNIKFTSTAVTKTAAGYDVKGMLQMRGMKKEITLPSTFANNTFKSKFSINRKDFGMVETTSNVGHIIQVDVTVPVTKQ